MKPRRTDAEVLNHILQNSRRDTSTGCLLWTLSCDRDGYGHIRFRGKNDRTHRAVWKLLKGNIPLGFCVCHRCDTPQCNNVDHYWLGTNKENTADREAKGRGANADENRARAIAQFSTPESRIAMSRAKGGRPFKDQFGTVYQTQVEAAAAIKVSRPHSIGRVLSGLRPHARGFKFSYLEAAQ